MPMATNNQESGHSDTHKTTSASTIGLGVMSSLSSERTQPLVGLAGSDPNTMFAWAPKNTQTRRPSAHHIPIKPSTGSGLLLDDSVSDPWSRSSKSGAHPSVGAVAPSGRSSFIEATSPLANGATVAAPSGMSLHGHHPRPSYGSALGNYDQPPAVYTKTDLPASMLDRDPVLHPLLPLNSSPADERRSWLASQPASSSPRNTGSRNNSLPPSRDGTAPLQHRHLPSINATAPKYSLALDSPANLTASLLGDMSLADSRAIPAVHHAGTSNHARHASAATDAHMEPRRSSRQYDSPLLPSHPQPRHTYQPSTSRIPVADPLSSAYTPSSAHQSTPRNVEPRADDRYYPDYPRFQHGAPQGPWSPYDHPDLQYHMRYAQPSAPMPQYGTTYTHTAHPTHAANPRDSYQMPAFRNNVLNEYRNSGRASGRYELRDVIGHVAEFCGDQHGSRFIQAKFATASVEEKRTVFREILDNGVKLMMDIFGNYVIQRLFDIGDAQQKTELAQTMTGHMVALSQHVYGCRVVQKILECEPIGEILVENPQTGQQVLTNQQAILIAELSNDVMRCVRDQNGNHVLQKAIERCKPEHIRFIFETFEGQVMSISQHSFGCRIIQRALEYCQKPEKDAIMIEIQGGMASLVSDNYGNYVVQYVIQFGNEAERRFALDVILSNLETFCKHKFASNVVEVCIKFGGPEFRTQLLDKFTAVNKRTQESMAFGLIKDGYGNYVIQRLLDALPKAEHQTFVDHLYPEVQRAKKTSSGKQLASIEKKMQRYGYTAPQSRAASAEGTPALTFTSIESSAICSINGDAGDGMPTQRKQQL